MTNLILLPAVLLRRACLLAACVAGAACRVFSDAAVDFATCINNAADRLEAAQHDTLVTECPTRGQRTVTVILLPPTVLAATDSQKVAVLRGLGLVNEAIFYSGPDSPSVGGVVRLAPVYAYDGGYTDNRRYSTTNSLGARIQIRQPMAKTGNHFRVRLRRASDSIEVAALYHDL